MQFISTRSAKNPVSFSQAIINCAPSDGGLYVPSNEENLRPWVLYMDDKTTFSGVAGTLTSALLKEEFSPVVSERIASLAFPFSPKLTALSDNIYMLELFHGPTGSHKDFGISYLASCLEHILIMKESSSIVLAVTTGDTGASIASSFRGKKKIQALLLYPKGTMRGLDESDFVWNGGNVYPVEVNGTLDDCYDLARSIYSDVSLVSQFGLTLANTANIGRLLPQTFFYVYAFAQLKAKVCSDIFYAMDAGNYGDLVAGLYAWKFSLPVNGFLTNSTPLLTVDPRGNSFLLDSLVPLHKRGFADFAAPSNIERLEEVFAANQSVLRGLVFPVTISEKEKSDAVKELFMTYSTLADPETAVAYMAAKKQKGVFFDDDTAVVLLSADHPSFSRASIKRLCGEEPDMPPHIKKLFEPVTPKVRIESERSAVIRILQELKR